jgi:hypothetical protein
MKKILLALAMAATLVGCGTTPPAKIEPSVVVQYKYVAAPIPEEFLVIPDKVQPIDLSVSTQKDVSDWLARSEGRTNDLEAKLRKVKDLQEKNKESK